MKTSRQQEQERERVVARLRQLSKTGWYVRLLSSQKTRMGSVKAVRFGNGRVSLLFNQDPRFTDAFPDVWVLETEVEECVRLTDEQVAAVNKLGKGNSESS